MNWLSFGMSEPLEACRSHRFIYGNTRIAGSSLQFTPGPEQMFTAWLTSRLIFAACFWLAWWAGLSGSTVFGLVLASLVLWRPIVWGRVMRYRAESVSWRGLSLRFTKGLPDIYAASWPVLIVAVAWGIGAPVIITLLDRLRPIAPTDTWMPSVVWGGGTLLLVVAISVMGFTAARLNGYRLSVQGLDLEGTPCHWKPPKGAVMKTWLAVVATILAAGGVALLLLTIVIGDAAPALADNDPPPILVAKVLAVVALVVLPARAYCDARMFILFWNSVRIGTTGRFVCKLHAGTCLFVVLRNDIVSFATLGLWLPFAAVGNHRLKAESVTLHLRGSLDQFRQVLPVRSLPRFGDAVADVAWFG